MDASEVISIITSKSNIKLLFRNCTHNKTNHKIDESAIHRIEISEKSSYKKGRLLY